MRRLSAEGLWVVSGQFVAAVGAVVGVRWMTELLRPDEYGKLALALTLVVLANQALFGPLGNGVGRFFAAAVEHRDSARYFDATLQLTRNAVFALLAALVVATAAVATAGVPVQYSTIAAATAFATFSSCVAIVAAIQAAARERAIVAGHQAFEAWARFLIAAALIVTLGGTSTIALVGYSSASAIVLVSQLWFLSRSIRSHVSTPSSMPLSAPHPPGATSTPEWKREIMRFSWPFSVFGIFTWLQMSSDRWALGYFRGVEPVGYYEVLFQLGYAPMLLASGIVVQLYAPIFFERSGASRDPARNARVHRSITRVTMLVCAATTIAALAGWALCDAIFRLAAGVQYRSVAYLLPWMIAAGGIFGAGQTVSLHFMTELKPARMLGAKITTALLGVAANCAGAYAFGVPGVVAASLGFSIAYFGWIAIAARRSLR